LEGILGDHYAILVLSDRDQVLDLQGILVRQVLILAGLGVRFNVSPAIAGVEGKSVLLKDCPINGDWACEALEIQDFPLELHPQGRVNHDRGISWIHLEVEVAEPRALN
jgi:hypothetical protein